MLDTWRCTHLTTWTRWLFCSEFVICQSPLNSESFAADVPKNPLQCSKLGLDQSARRGRRSRESISQLCLTANHDLWLVTRGQPEARSARPVGHLTVITFTALRLLLLCTAALSAFESFILVHFSAHILILSFNFRDEDLFFWLLLQRY